MTAYVYVLGSFHKGRHISYVGWTDDVARRLKKHNDGTGARTTRGRVWALLHTEEFETRNEAMSREWHLKRDRAFRKKLLDAGRASRERLQGGKTSPRKISRRKMPPRKSPR